MSQEYCTEIKNWKIRGCIEPDCGASAQGKTDKCVALQPCSSVVLRSAFASISIFTVS
jgi:hypothetical protein